MLGFSVSIIVTPRESATTTGQKKRELKSSPSRKYSVPKLPWIEPALRTGSGGEILRTRCDASLKNIGASH